MLKIEDFDHVKYPEHCVVVKHSDNYELNKKITLDFLNLNLLDESLDQIIDVQLKYEKDQNKVSFLKDQWQAIKNTNTHRKTIDVAKHLVALNDLGLDPLIKIVKDENLVKEYAKDFQLILMTLETQAFLLKQLVARNSMLETVLS